MLLLGKVFCPVSEHLGASFQEMQVFLFLRSFSAERVHAATQ